ncbi:MAG: 30S ribosomal protein S4 [Crenarchaeota archaeon]|nr:30S ribosomal protein S4 [Thermoproteota archaeon]MCR8453820.1 30S ribosomal protein S4 [Thermoproteota archaeon]MCR8455629.1 30S ribosomal protein S4 [Thermoproteota archaeon]MCR8462631.1 30S ribosomal protein S4 [Thermoproteota archaeon]MCR8470940.1 30S ribosomal protein S4 [Thermoproteota archaeon]
MRSLRKKYKTPRKPFEKDRLIEEMRLIGEYGLRNKHELWRTKTMLSEIRRRARELLALPPDERKNEEEALIGRLYQLGILEKNSTLDDILKLRVEDLLERRLQTVVWRLGYAKTPHQARQMIVHRHIIVNGKIVTIPSFLVKRDDVVEIHPRSPFAKALQEG